MLKIGFGRSIKPRSFDYIPRFYDPEKERLQENIKRFEEEKANQGDFENLKSRIRSGMRMKYNGDVATYSKFKAQSNLRLIMIIMVLGFACYILMSSNKIITLIEAFSK